MKGIIFNLLEEVVTQQFGQDTWDKLLDTAGVDGAFTSLGNYPDEHLFKLVAAASADLDRPPNEIVRWFGTKAIPLLAREICAYTGWPVGHAYLVAENSTDPLIPTALWHLDHPERFAAFREITEATRFRRGEGLPGRVLDGGRQAWIVDVTQDNNFPRARHAIDIGVRGAFGFPVLAGPTVVAVLEFFSREPVQPDEVQREIAAQVGTQLGRIFERERASEALLAVNNQMHQEIVVRRAAQETLHQAHEQLERRVEERTKELQIANTELSAEIAFRERAQQELEATHKRLLEASRLAGMAEVATGVLHNVGNVLNSVNISASLVADSLKRSKAANLAKVVALLKEGADDLGAFITADPRGMQLPSYLGQLSDHLAAEQAALLKEMDLLRHNVEHIKEIVAMQQGYATASGVTETVKVADLVDDALRLNEGALDRHGVRVIREIEATPPILVEKHKVLQILVNLIRNAKYACDESGRTDKQLTIRLSNVDHRVQITVIDNGVGIPKENLTRIFAHGFTTRKDGHGFGLHSGALAACELGGRLSAHSDGAGKGATFILELP